MSFFAVSQSASYELSYTSVIFNGPSCMFDCFSILDVLEGRGLLAIEKVTKGFSGQQSQG
jgi:hypothetical protein